MWTSSALLSGSPLQSYSFSWSIALDSTRCGCLRKASSSAHSRGVKSTLLPCQSTWRVAGSYASAPCRHTACTRPTERLPIARRRAASSSMLIGLTDSRQRPHRGPRSSARQRRALSGRGSARFDPLGASVEAMSSRPFRGGQGRASRRRRSAPAIAALALAPSANQSTMWPSCAIPPQAHRPAAGRLR